MNLPVPDLAAALPFYETVLGFRVESRDDAPHRSAVLAPHAVRMRLAESGGDPSQGRGARSTCAGSRRCWTSSAQRGLRKQRSDVGVETMDGAPWRVFYVVAPDGLCFWFGERES